MKTRIRRVRLRIRYKRRSDLVALAALLILVLATAIFLGHLAWGSEEAAAGTQAAPAAFTGMRKYYITQSYDFDGDEALTACAPGYHMASLWEILDPSNLEYNTDLGATRDDSGAGPPAFYYGLVRTGWDSEAGSDISRLAGQDNCAAWTSDDLGHWGTEALLWPGWTADNEDMHVWAVDNYRCERPKYVWCVEDYPSFTYTFLPLALRNH